MRILICLLLFASVRSCSVDPITPLIDFVNSPDPIYKWDFYNAITGPSYDIYVLKLTSLTWLTPQDTDTNIWTHWLTICVPHTLSSNTKLGVIYVDGGSTNDPVPDADTLGGYLAVKTNTIVAHLYEVPDEPIMFKDEVPPRKRSEDALIAYTWSHFFNNTNQPNWLAYLPMVKSVVKAMDAIQDFTGSIGLPVPSEFCISGGSKRGWTTWLTPAVDKRVTVIVPIVMPILNMIPVINALWRSLGEWSFALKDYVALDVMDWLFTPQFKAMANIIDPNVYQNSLARVPKYFVMACGDEFLVPDSPKQFWRQLSGLKHLRLVPNAEHSLAGQTYEVLNQISSFVYMFINNDLPASLNYTLVYSNQTASITVKPTRTPASVTLWQATTWSTTRRDFRLIICSDIKNPDCFQPVFWLPTTLAPNPDGTYSASIAAPNEGWIGFLIEIEYQSTIDPNQFFEVTSEINIVPDIYPYPDFSPNKF